MESIPVQKRSPCILRLHPYTADLPIGISGGAAKIERNAGGVFSCFGGNILGISSDRNQLFSLNIGVFR
jgi:hypothetical protein